MIYDAYTDFTCAALVAEKPGPWFIPQRGVHQGAPMSMHLYQIFINELLIRLRSCSFVVDLYGIDTTCPTYADDIALCALQKYGLNKLRNIAYDYSKKWQFVFNETKRVVMVFGKDNSPEIPINLGETKLYLCGPVQAYGDTVVHIKSC